LSVLRIGSSSVALGDGVLPGVQGQAGPSWPVRDEKPIERSFSILASKN
jgi:hypothetical protein